MSDSKSIQIKLFRLTKVNTLVPCETSRLVVAAANEIQARQVANENSDDGSFYWTDGTLVNCEELGVANDGISGCLAVERQ